MDLTKAFDLLNHDLLLQSSIQMISNMMHWNLFKIQHLFMERDNTRGCWRLCFCSRYYSCYISCLCQWSVLLKYVIVLMILFFMFAIENFREWWNMSLFPANLYFGEDIFSIKISHPSRRLEDVLRRCLQDQTFLRRLARRETVTLLYDKNREQFCDLIRSWLCSTSL